MERINLEILSYFKLLGKPKRRKDIWAFKDATQISFVFYELKGN